MRLVASLAEPAPMLIQMRRVFPDPPEQVTVRVAVMSTAAPARVFTLPNAMLPMVTVQVCAKEYEQNLSNAAIVQVVRTINANTNGCMTGSGARKCNRSSTGTYLVNR